MVKRRIYNFFSYLQIIYIGFKNRFKTIFGMAAGALIAPIIIAAAFLAAGPIIAGAFSPPKLVLLFCDLEGSAYFDTVLGLLLSDESVTKTATVKKMDYAEALAVLDTGGADALIVFPESFISDMSRGINKPIKILSAESDPVRTVFVKEFIRSAADELSAAQSAINTVWFHMDLEKMSDMRRNIAFTSLVLEYTSKAFARSIYYTFRDVESAYEGGAPAAFLTVSALAAFVFFGSLSGIKQIMNERSHGVTARLAASGVTAPKIVIYHFIPIYLRQLLCACFAVLIALPAVTLATKAVDGGAGAAAFEPAGIVDMNGVENSEGKRADGAGDIIGGVINSAIGRPRGEGSGGERSERDGSENVDASGDADDRSITETKGGGAGGTDANELSDAHGAETLNTRPDRGTRFGISDIPALFAATFTRENAARLPGAFSAMCILCLLCTSIAVFAGNILARPESADILIITLGILMAIAGGGIIPYQFLPDIVKTAGPFSYNMWAMRIIASPLFGQPAAAAPAAVASAQAAFICVAAGFIAASIIRVKVKQCA